MPDERLSKEWDRQLEFGLPDARLKYGDREEIKFGKMTWFKVFCVNCGCDGGMVTAQTLYAFYLCDKCVFTHGAPPGCVEVKV